MIKSRHCVKKEGKKVQEGVYTIYLLLGQQVHRAEVTDIWILRILQMSRILRILRADIINITNIADIAVS